MNRESTINYSSHNVLKKPLLHSQFTSNSPFIKLIVLNEIYLNILGYQEQASQCIENTLNLKNK